MSSSVSLNTPYAGTVTGSSVSTATTTTATTTTSTSTSMADTFLTLLVAEIQNQDPTDPTDPTEYVTQLASMAQVAMAEEVATEMNTNAILMSNLQVMALGKMVGDPIMVQTTTLEVSDGAIQGRIDLDDACTQVDIHLTDAIGNDYDIPLTGSSFGPGAVTFSIDPVDYGIPPGDYSVSVVTDTGEEEVPVEVAGVVTDVRIPLDGGTPLLNVSGVGEVPFTMISQFGVPDDTPAQDVV
ncbi:flagellar hook capping FlgD N-terminal domain-containing protein [Pseudescherichia sp.]|uniref:flagellar hook capping FlgD N-terminal domain-containing protein n=1 Tax=Pseudescherichia sp. TaxID=2055881 RepID=UPI0028AB7682|nr:flagellar hook capping FlgD N-terminal domain-containing protein [Pseudescherichia sp.]